MVFVRQHLADLAVKSSILLLFGVTGTKSVQRKSICIRSKDW